MKTASKQLSLLAVALIVSACAHQTPHNEPFGPEVSWPNAGAAVLLAKIEKDPGQAADLAWLAGNNRPMAREILDRGIAAEPNNPSLYLRRALLGITELRAAEAHADLLSVIRTDREGDAAEFALQLLLEEPLISLEAKRPSTAVALEAASLNEVRASPRLQVLRVRLAHQIARFNAKSVGAAFVEAEALRFAKAGVLSRVSSRGPLAPWGYSSLETPSPWELAAPGGVPAPPPLPLGAFHREIEERGGVLEPARGQDSGLYVSEVCFRAGGTDARRARFFIDPRLPFRVRLDGELLHERIEVDEDLPGSTERWVELEPGWHHIVIASLAAPRLAFAIHLFAENGEALEFETQPSLPKGASLSPSRILAAKDARQAAVAQISRAFRVPLDALAVRAWLGQASLGSALRDLELARIALWPALRIAPESAVLASLRARVMRAEGLPRALVEAELRRGLELDPTEPSLLRSVAYALSADEPDRALQLAARLQAAAPHSSAADELAFRTHVRRGWNHEAEIALLAAEAKGPSPRFHDAAAAFFRSQFRLAEAEKRETAAQATRSVRPRSSRARDALESGDPERALSLLRKNAERSADPAEPIRRIAEIEMMRGNFQPAFEAAVEIERLAPWSSAGAEQAAAAKLGQGDAAGVAEYLLRLRALGLETVEIEDLLAEVQGRAPGDPKPGSKLAGALALDAKAIASAAIEPQFQGFREVQLLDRVVDYVRPSGRALSLRHSLSRLETKEATDRAGEFRLPEQAIALELRTLKSDGRIIEIDEHEGKADISFSALAPGDTVERKWVLIDGPATPLGGYHRSVFFRDDVPSMRTQLFVVVEKGTPMNWHSYHGAPEPKVIEDGDQTVYLFEREKTPGMRLEPMSVAYEEYVPFVEVWVGLDEATAVRANRGRHLGAVRSTYAVREKARALAAEESDERASVERLFRFVLDEIRPGPANSPSVTLSLGRGNRLNLFAALAKAAGLDAALVLARGGGEGAVEPRAPDASHFTHPLVRIVLRSTGERLFADLGGSHRGAEGAGWLGRAPARFRGGKHIAVDDIQGVPSPFAEHEVEGNETQTEVLLEVLDSGDAKGSIVLSVPGGPGALIKEALRPMRAHELQQALQGLLANTVPGAEVTAIESAGMDDRFAPLNLRIEVLVHGLLSLENAAMVSNRFFPRMVSGALGGLLPFEQLIQVPSRESPMLLPTAAERLRVTLRMPEGTPAPTTRPEAFEREGFWGAMRQTFGYAGRTLSFEREIRLAGGRVSPAQYPEFYGLIQELAQRMKNQLRFERRAESAVLR